MSGIGNGSFNNTKDNAEETFFYIDESNGLYTCRITYICGGSGEISDGSVRKEFFYADDKYRHTISPLALPRNMQEVFCNEPWRSSYRNVIGREICVLVSDAFVKNEIGEYCFFGYLISEDEGKTWKCEPKTDGNADALYTEKISPYKEFLRRSGLPEESIINENCSQKSALRRAAGNMNTGASYSRRRQSSLYSAAQMQTQQFEPQDMSRSLRTNIPNPGAAARFQSAMLETSAKEYFLGIDAKLKVYLCVIEYGHIDNKVVRCKKKTFYLYGDRFAEEAEGKDLPIIQDIFYNMPVYSPYNDGEKKIYWKAEAFIKDWENEYIFCGYLVCSNVNSVNKSPKTWTFKGLEDYGNDSGYVSRDSMYMRYMEEKGLKIWNKTALLYDGNNLPSERGAAYVCCPDVGMAGSLGELHERMPSDAVLNRECVSVFNKCINSDSEEEQAKISKLGRETSINISFDTEDEFSEGDGLTCYLKHTAESYKVELYPNIMIKYPVGRELYEFFYDIDGEGEKVELILPCIAKFDKIRNVYKILMYGKILLH